MTVTIDQLVPAVGATFGLAVCLFGGRFTRLYSFVLGFLLGTSFTFWIFESQLALRHAGVPLIVGLLVSLISGVVCLLLHMITLAVILGYTFASMLMVIDNDIFFVYYRTAVYVFAIVCALYFTYTRPTQSQRLTTATSGALIVVLGIDSYASRSIGALIFQDTFLEYPMEVESAVARCFTWKCWILLPVWVGLSAMGYATQCLSAKLRAFEQHWPLLFQAPKRANFSTRSSPLAPEAAAASGLVAEDRNYSISNYASYDSFLKIQNAQAAAQASQLAQQQAAMQQHRSQPVAHPELGSAHADDKVSLPPVQRAAFNFLELRRLPQAQHYLYLLIHHAFTSLAHNFGFQIDNVHNQYEHLLFLLNNYQNKPPSVAAAAAGLATVSGLHRSPSGGSGGVDGYQSGPAGGATATGATAGQGQGQPPNGDAISQLHARLFSNYREWIRYMNLGGNSTLGGSAMSSDVVALVRSQIAEARVDKNTTDAKVEEICLWLLVWGEAGTLRHTPECLMYLFHCMAGENRRMQRRYGGSLEDVVAGNPSATSASASAGVAAGAAAAAARPRRAHGDFLSMVVRPLYEVVAFESSKAGGRNYDDLNEFFWRTECLDYFYADPKYRLDERAPPSASASGARASARDPEDPPSLRASVSVSVALRAGKKSFLEKRSWLHPLRSFMRLLSFYGVCFHILVCIAYIHYANLALLGPESNAILSSFVISLAGWSLAKEGFELWATWGIVSDSVWNAIGFLMRGAIKASLFLLLVCFYTWSVANDEPLLRAQYAHAYFAVACLYLLPTAASILTQLFPTLGARILAAHIPFLDELLKFWYPIQKAYVGRDVHEPEGAVYKYQVFWVLLLLWKMYMSLLFQVSPLIEPTVDILEHVATLSVSTHLWARWLCYVQIALLWTPFVLVYMFDTVIWFFLWQAVGGLLVGMNMRLGEIRAFPQLVKVFTQLPKQFDAKIIYNASKARGAAAAVAVPARHSAGGSGANTPNKHPSSPALPVHPRTGEAASLLALGAGGHMVANAGQSSGSAAGRHPQTHAQAQAQVQAHAQAQAQEAAKSDHMAQPLTMARARRNSLGGGPASAALVAAAAAASSTTGTTTAPRLDPFRNRAWEDFAVVWNEIIEDLRLGDLLSNAERGTLRFRFDTTSTKEYYLPLFLLVGHIDEAMEHAISAQADWNAALKSEGGNGSGRGGGMTSHEKSAREDALLGYLLEENPLRAECLSEAWEHVCWLLLHLLGERHAALLQLTFKRMGEVLLGNHHVLRGTNLASLAKFKNDLLNLVRGLRIASASFATLRLQEAEKKNAAELARQEAEEMEREDSLRAALEEAEEAEAAAEEAEAAAEEADGAVRSASDDEEGNEEAARRAALRASRKRLIQEAERSTQQRSSLARAREFNLKSMLKSPSVGTLNMLEQLSSRPRHRSAAFVAPRSGASSNRGSFNNLAAAAAEGGAERETGYLILHISLIRDQLSALLNSLAACFNPRYNADLERDAAFTRGSGAASGGASGAGGSGAPPNVAADIVGAIKHIHISNEGFMWDGAYAGAQIHALLSDPHTNTALATMHSLLTVAAIDVQPRNLEATRRLLFFANSLFMDLPVAPSVRAMKSFSTLTPFHSEDIVYSFSDLNKTTEDGVSVFLYLQTIYPQEWKNFLERVGIAEEEWNTNGSARLLTANPKHNLEARLWATMRGQTLGRTVDGMMLYEKALKLLLKLEEPDSTAATGIGSGAASASSRGLSASSHSNSSELDDHSLLVQTKFSYVISCQEYGSQKRQNDPKAADIEFLLHRYPSVRVAYIDSVKVPFVDAIRYPGQTLVRDEFYSVLIKSERHPLTGAAEVREVYRVQLPGSPMLGEGKPENQNHAIIFTRGEMLQTIDMNQSNYFEEALKMRNLLEEFEPMPEQDRVPARNAAAAAAAHAAGEETAASKRTAIVGFREHIYTGGLSSIANFMALQEGTFVTQGQRVLDNPLRVRFHYGHPDCTAFGTLLARADGSPVKCEDVVAGDLLVGQDGSVAEVDFVEHGDSRDCYALDTAAGGYTVTAGHKLVLRCSGGPTGTGVVSFHDAEKRQTVLLKAGDLVDVRAAVLADNWTAWQMGTPNALFSGRRVAIPSGPVAPAHDDAVPAQVHAQTEGDEAALAKANSLSESIPIHSMTHVPSLTRVVNIAITRGSSLGSHRYALANGTLTRNCFDKLFFMSRGGVSKASRGINLSEDIFAGFNSVLRGGGVKFREYIQVGKGRDVGLQQLFKFEAKLSQGNAMQSISRDIYRLANTFDFFRLCSFFFGGVGFYITNCLTIWALYLFIYCRLVLGAFRLESLDSFSGADTISYWFGMIGFLLTLPIFATIGLERGFRRGLLEVLRMVVTGGPLFFMFHMGTKSFYFEQTMLAGGAKYRPTGRGFVTRHEHFAEIYRFHASSHFYRSVELLLALLLYALVIPPTYDYSLVTWAGWLIVVSWLFGPFWFNPLAFEYEKLVADVENFSEWMGRREGDGDKSWKAWWKDENSYMHGLATSARVTLSLFQLRYVVVCCALIYFVDASRAQVGVAAVMLATFLSLVVFVRARISLTHQRTVRLLKGGVSLALLVGLLALVSLYTLSAREWFQYLVAVAALTYAFHACCNVALVFGVRARMLARWYKMVDWAVAGSLFAVLGALSITVIPGMVQTRLMFHNAFSRGVLIDKLLRTKPDEESSSGGGGGRGGSGGSRSAGRGGRRKDARAGREDDDSPDSAMPETSPTHGFDLQAISFIEKRSNVPRKKLHPSAEEAPMLSRPGGGNSGGGGAKKQSVSFGGATSSSAGSGSMGSGLGPRRVQSITDLAITEETPDQYNTPSPHVHPLPSYAMAAPGSPAMHLPVSTLAGRPAPASAFGGSHSPLTVAASGSLPTRPGSILSSMSGVRSASDGTALSPTGTHGQPMSFPPTVPAVSSVAQASRQGSAGTYSPVLAAHSLAHSGSASSTNSPRTDSPAPASPIAASVSLRSRSDKLVGLGLPPTIKQDERPIPKTVPPPVASAAAKSSPFNPRRA